MKKLEYLKKLSNSFALVKNGKGELFLLSEEDDLLIKIKKNGYIPKSGLCLIDFLKGVNIYGDVLDIGTGETGLLANYAFKRGAKDVIACDKDANAINHARESSPFSEKIKWVNGDIFNNVPKQLFDFIFSNPPQMPMRYQGELHDYGGQDGRCAILKILSSAASYLKNDGRLFILCFDFLGVENRFNSDESICEIAERQGLSCNIVASYIRTIRPNGKTMESIPWINHVYPEYEFKMDEKGNTYNKLFIVEFKIKGQ